jgi:chromosome partitioning protein
MIIVYGNLKGGTGKTTSSIYTAELCSVVGRTLLVDLDPQGNATSWYGGKPGRIVKVRDGLDILGSGIQQSMNEYVKVDFVPNLVKNKVYSFTIIDTPHGFGSVVRSALAAADLIIVPVTPMLWSADGAADILANVPCPAMLLPCIVPRWNLRFAKNLTSTFGGVKILSPVWRVHRTETLNRRLLKRYKEVLKGVITW